MLQTSNGFNKPETGDKGSIFFPALEENIQQLNDHSHDGEDTNKLTTIAFNHNSSDALSSNWGLELVAKPGQYRQLVTLPVVGTVPLTLGNIGLFVIDADTGHPHYPTIEQNTATTFYIYTNDSNLSFKIIYV